MSKDRAPYAPIYAEDFMTGCRKAFMTPEQVGVYIFMLLMEWLDQDSLVDNPSRLAMRMGWDIRLVKRLVNEVVETGRYKRKDGRLSNERMQEEIAEYFAKLSARKAKSQVQQHDNFAGADQELPGRSAEANQELLDNSAIANGDLSRKAKESNVNGSANASHARAHDSESESYSKRNTPLPPSDEGGTSVRSKKAKKKRDPATADAQARALALEAIELYNGAAKALGFVPCLTPTVGRLGRLYERIADIGGIEKFRQALWAVRNDDWLMGRVSRRGVKPFKLDIDRLMQTNGNMGDVLARLIDSLEGKTPTGGESGLSPNWWKGDENLRVARMLPEGWWQSLIKKFANGVWPVEFLGPGPWDRECLVPAKVIADLGLAAKYPTRAGVCVAQLNK